MNAAWEQIGDVLEANRRIRVAQLAKLAAASWYARELRPLLAARPERALAITAPGAAPCGRRRVDGRDHRRAASLVPPALTSTAMRRLARPARADHACAAVRRRGPPGHAARRVNDGEVSAAPPKTTPPGVVTTDEVADLHAAGRTCRRGRRCAAPMALAGAGDARCRGARRSCSRCAARVAGGRRSRPRWSSARSWRRCWSLWRLLQRWAAAIARSDVLRRGRPDARRPSTSCPTSPDFTLIRARRRRHARPPATTDSVRGGALQAGAARLARVARGERRARRSNPTRSDVSTSAGLAGDTRDGASTRT